MTPTVFHIAARTVATHALSIFGDHSDVMAARSTGWAMLASSSVQEAQDLALVAHAATLRSRVPIVHFFDGFRTSHEVNKIELLTREDVRAMIDQPLVEEHRARGLSPDRPVLRGSAQNPDVFFQAREAVNPFYLATPGIVQEAMDELAARTGRSYRLFDYHGAPDARDVVVIIGSGTGAVAEAGGLGVARGERTGVVTVRLYRPFDGAALVRALPPTVERIAVLDRTKEPGAVGEPLYLDVLAALAEHWADRDGAGPLPTVIGGRYGLSSKEFTPAMAQAVFTNLRQPAGRRKRHFTVGIYDDVTHLSLPIEESSGGEAADVARAVFYGLGSDGTVGASKNSVKIVGAATDLHAQGYFVYDSKKSGAVTVSHLRFSPRPIRSSYLIDQATFVACHQFHLLEQIDVLQAAAPGATLLLNSPYPPEATWDQLPFEVQRQAIDKRLRVFAVDAHGVAKAAGIKGRINTVMQTCFFALSGVLPRDAAVEHIKAATRKSYGSRGEEGVAQNFAAIEGALAGLVEIPVPAEPTSSRRLRAAIAPAAPDFAERVIGAIIAGRGDLLPVSAMPVDGTFPTGTARYEKRSIAAEIPIWEPPLCIDCGLCALVCPHAAIRLKAFPASAVDEAPASFAAKPWREKGYDDHRLTVQVAPDDCTGCGVCVDVCPGKSKEDSGRRAIVMTAKGPHLDRERANFDFFLTIPQLDRATPKAETVKGSQLLEPLFEFSGACAGCGETPYLKLMSQLFGDRAVVANATGCSSIYGGNLPTTPWTVNQEGRGPAWCNSLFEDNAEFGLG
ncbi:MAG TPA: pyruvate:ferredoxin (flavodoxin) oxidoreductase, partial [Lacipirellulaceae bacterium]|nr:pyruvate:ferredoxin (flavodoxin) oxidoreductase [Lacipirellulaceae bacterium]